MSVAHWLVRALEALGIDTVFGIPGVHTIELYRGLEGSRLRHVTPRHEQGAGFMADGYARASGRPAACFIITGPGMTNIATAMGQALADSVPMLVISSVNRRAELGMGEGRLHELPSRQQTLSGVSLFSHTLLDPANLPRVLTRAWTLLHTGRPGPVHIEIPRDLLDAPLDAELPVPGRCHPPQAATAALDQAAAWLGAARRPLLLLGGGAIADPAAARALAERLDAPTLTTINARGVMGRGHPLDLGANATWPEVRALVAEADVVLAIGTELGETDYDVTFDGGFTLPERLIRIDIDPRQLCGNHLPALGIVAEAGAAMRDLLPRLAPGAHDAAARVAELKAALALATRPDFAPFVPLFDALDQHRRDAVLVGDSTAPVYAGNHLAQRDATRGWFNASTGYGTLGYGLPAAIGAALACPERPVVALVGDGGVMFTLAELATAVELALPLTLVLWHNAGYAEIRQAMTHAGIAPLGVDPAAPAFLPLAHAFGCAAERISSPAALAEALATPCTAPRLLEIDAAAWQAATSPASRGSAATP
ncbi:5-guanidino-2-oxopentanoate decarboxylase [Salinicola sp. CR57]|uniref:5-guanidino-2-oxopentanoate decarboxylase n=1 Tax=Salinicola sp. CR57 TaxID=1949086 RepID=UPI000DA24433|nr:5-guanidino-2-oxopentanoate decarboxylase [Salinicola sp. CR57]